MESPSKLFLFFTNGACLGGEEQQLAHAPWPKEE
jgi:hypothetical protein